jgi:hypothetical protein
MNYSTDSEAQPSLAEDLGMLGLLSDETTQEQRRIRALKEAAAMVRRMPRLDPKLPPLRLDRQTPPIRMDSMLTGVLIRPLPPESPESLGIPTMADIRDVQTFELRIADVISREYNALSGETGPRSAVARAIREVIETARVGYADPDAMMATKSIDCSYPRTSPWLHVTLVVGMTTMRIWVKERFLDVDVDTAWNWALQTLQQAGIAIQPVVRNENLPGGGPIATPETKPVLRKIDFDT